MLSQVLAAWACVIMGSIDEARERVIAVEPLVRNPVGVAAGSDGALWIVDRDAKTGFDSIVVLRDDNRDGEMDSAVTFATNLVDVQGVVPLSASRALVLEPPQLFDAEDRDGDGGAERVEIALRGLDAATGVAIVDTASGDEIVFAGAGGNGLAARASGIAVGRDGTLVVARDGLVVRGGAASVVGLGSFVDLAETDHGIVGIAASRDALIRPVPVHERWSHTKPREPDVLWRSDPDQGPIAAIDRYGPSSVVVAVGAREGRAGRIIVVDVPPPIDASQPVAPLTSTSADDERRRALDEALRGSDDSRRRAAVESVFIDGDHSMALERVAAALRLNDRRPGRLALDRQPGGLDLAAVESLDPVRQRIVRRLAWPGRSDEFVDRDPPPTSAELIERGRRLYSSCLTCHGPAGLGQPGVYPPLAGSEFVLGNPERLASIVLHGLEGPITVGGRPFSGLMPPPPMRDDEEIAAVLTYVRQAFGNNAPPVSADTVTSVRKRHLDRRRPWTAAELEGH